jgi:hypothetical protein
MDRRATPALNGFVLGFLLLAAVLLSACGRVGVNLVPFGSQTPDGGPNNGDSGPGGDASTDASPNADASADAGPNADAGTDAGPNACLDPCQNPNGAAECSEGQCVITCSTGYLDCDEDASNGCETNTTDQTSSCGECGRACTNPHGEAVCDQGLCLPTCASGYADCDANAANGCEADLNDEAHCGSCGNACINLHGTTGCEAGSCVPSCDPGFTDCDGDPDNGCETNTGSDPEHCGSCTGVCNPISQFCNAGTCEISACSPGRGECDGSPDVGCETDLETSVDNCGFCGNVCQVANGSGDCAAGSCVVAGCNGNFGNCDGLGANGCETPLQSTTSHCGSCGSPCTNAHGATSCAAGSCVPSCSSGWGDCDPNRRNGCETALNTISNCGMCGRVCPANGGTPLCNAGVCGVQCDLAGTYALKLTVPTTWPGTSLIDAGSGDFKFWARLVFTQNGTALTGTVTTCDHVVPDFAGGLNEDYGIIYPASIFAAALPSLATSATLGGTGPGSSFTLARSALMLGLRMNNPVLDPWPSAGSVMQVDSDGDGKPGVTATYKSTGGFSRPPVNGFGTARAQTGYMAARVVFQLAGTLTSCTQSSGSATVQDIDSRTLGCRISGGSRDCNGSEQNHLDSNAPGYQTRPSTYTLTKVAAGSSCATVRATLP